jgi:hypothetical protein
LSSGKDLFKIVENSAGKRKTPNGVGFFNGKRIYEREI